MNEEFAKRIYKTLVEEGIDLYKELYTKTEITENVIDYWKDAINLYNTFDDKEKAVFNNILKQMIIDTISGVFGILDGSSTLTGGSMEFNVKINGADTRQELQDSFLEYVEEKYDEENY